MQLQQVNSFLKNRTTFFDKLSSAYLFNAGSMNCI